MAKKAQQITASDGTQLYWQAWEPDEEIQATVCFVHGLGEHSGRYAHVAEAFVAPVGGPRDSSMPVTGLSSKSANARNVTSPPGGQRLMGAASPSMASA